MVSDLVGRRCISIRRFRHVQSGVPAQDAGPIEFGWDNGSHLTIDAHAEWTLAVSRVPWRDPFGNLSGPEREALAGEVGLWSEAPIDPGLTRLIGRHLLSIDSLLNEVGELTGLRLLIDRTAVVARIYDGEVTVELVDA